MAAIPRIVTADATGNIARLVRSAVELLELSVVQIDAPSGAAALPVVEDANLVIAPYDLEDNMKGVEFAARVKRNSPSTSIIIMGELGDPEELYEEDPVNSPFVYLFRPVEAQLFLRILVAGMESHEAMVTALAAPVEKAAAQEVADMGPVPPIDVNATQPILDGLLRDLGAMAIILATRTGETLLERGAFGYVNRDQLAQAVKPTMLTNIDMKDLVGGDVSSIQFYDGAEYDVFVLTVGLHHFLCVMFEGQQGSRQFGIVNRYGRSAVQDLIALLGANAFMLQKPVAAKAPEPPKRAPTKRITQDLMPVVSLEPAAFDNAPQMGEVEEEEPVLLPQLEPIQNLDLDRLFGARAGSGEDLFSLDNIEALAKEQEEKDRKGTLNWEQAQELGLVPKQ